MAIVKNSEVKEVKSGWWMGVGMAAAAIAVGAAWAFIRPYVMKAKAKVS